MLSFCFFLFKDGRHSRKGGFHPTANNAFKTCLKVSKIDYWGEGKG